MAERGPYMRATGVLMENGRLLLVRQALRERARWNLPGGRVERGERPADAVEREMFEETGLLVETTGLLYVCERTKSLGNLVLDVSMLVRRTGGHLRERRHDDGEDERITCARMVPLDELADYGMGTRIAELARTDWPARGYRGDFHAWWG